MKKSIVLAILLPTFLFACSNSPYTYHQNPTPLKKGQTHYAIKAPVVNLSLGHGAIPGDNSFATQEILGQQFNRSLIDSFAAKKIYVASENEAAAVVEVVLDYTRTFNYGGKALNKPAFSYHVAIKKDNTLLATYSVQRKTTKYNAMKEMAVNLQVSTFKWGAEDEPQDIAWIAQAIAAEVAEMGSK